jgi:hypothetical protein
VNQATLPFPEWCLVSPAHAELLRLANAAAPEDGYSRHDDWHPFRKVWKTLYFYPFKADFLERHAVPDGYDLQCLTLHCRGCGGTGIWRSMYSARRESCDRCWGSGVYRRDAVKLSRWKLGELVFHCPEERWREVGEDRHVELRSGAHSEIAGLIKHEPVAGRVGVKAFLRLAWHYDRALFYRCMEIRVNEALSRLVRRLLAPINALGCRVRDWLFYDDSRLAGDFRELLSITPVVDDVPF